MVKSDKNSDKKKKKKIKKTSAKNKKKYNLRKRKEVINYNIHSDDSDASDDTYYPYEQTDDSDNGGQEFSNQKEYHKFLSKLFPSKYMSDKVEQDNVNIIFTMGGHQEEYGTDYDYSSEEDF